MPSSQNHLRSKAGKQTLTKTINETLIDVFGLQQNPSDNCLYSSSSSECVVMIALYVDDLPIAYNNVLRLSKSKITFGYGFWLKDLNEACRCLGFEVNHDARNSFLSLFQKRHIEKILPHFGVETAKGSHTSKNTGNNFSCFNEIAEYRSYREAIGCLAYPMVGTRFDSDVAVRRLAKFVESVTRLHWQAVKRIMRYPESAKAYRLPYKSDKTIKLIEYVESVCAGDLTCRKSTSVYDFFMACAAILRYYQLQEVIALSSSEAEYASLTSKKKGIMSLTTALATGCRCGPVQRSDEDLCWQSKVYGPGAGGCNKPPHHALWSALSLLSKSSVSTKVTKVEYCRTEDMRADLLRKDL